MSRQNGPSAPPILEVLEPGLATSVQDLGRPGLGAFGVPPGGAADPWSLAVANELLGNARDAPGLELTLVGATLRVLGRTTLAIGGADLAGHVVDTGQPLRPGTAVRLKAGQVVRFPGPSARGCRAYLAVPGGFEVPRVLGSASTLAGSGLDGIPGRPLRAGDRLVAGSTRLPSPAAWPGPLLASDLEWDPVGGGPGAADEGRGAAGRAGRGASGPGWVRVIAGPHAEQLGDRALGSLLERPWTVGPASDRIGLRLAGSPLPARPIAELGSLGVTWGTIQVPPDRRPIVLLADHQPTGGYPVIAVAITADRSALGQLGPGATVRFALVSRAEAMAALGAIGDALAAGAARLHAEATWDELWGSMGS